MQNKVFFKLNLFLFFTVIYTVNVRTPAMQLSMRKQQKKWPNWFGRSHVFIHDVKSDKHRDAQRLQNMWESISMEMGVHGMDGKRGCNHARVRVKEFKPNQGQRKRFILGMGIDPKRKYHSIQLSFYFSVLH